MYRIMITKDKKAGFDAQYKFMTSITDGVTLPVEIESKEKLDAKVEHMLNKEGYSKSDFIIVEVINYSIDAKDYTDDDSETDFSDEPDDSDDSDPEVTDSSEDEDEGN